MAVQADNYTKVYELIDQGYTKAMMDAFYKAFLKKFILDNEDLCRRCRVPVERIRTMKSTKKGDLMDIFVPFFAYGELFRVMKAALSPTVANVLEMIIWEGPQDHSALEKRFAIKIAFTHRDLNTHYVNNALDELNPMYCLFRDNALYRSDYWYFTSKRELDDKTSFTHTLFLDPPIRTILKGYLDKPAEYNLLPLTSIELAEFATIDSTAIFSELAIVLAYIQQGKLAGADTGKVVAASFNKMRKYCDIAEFYPEDSDKGLASLRTRLVAELLMMMVGKEKDQYTDPAAFIKKTFEEYQKSRSANTMLLFHLKGMNKVSKETLVSDKLFGLLKEMPLLEWISAENVVKYAIYRDLNLNIFTEYDARNVVHLEYDGDYSKYRQPVSAGYYHSFIIEPLLQGSLFLFAAFGLVEIAYDQPASAVAENFKRPYISAFNGVRYVRLTPFGAYVCGRNNAFKAPDTQDQNVLLDEDNLFISYRGDNRSLQSVLEKIGKPAGGNKNLYKVDYETLLGDCNTEKEIDSKINLFKQLLSNNPPPLWTNFFATLQRQSYQLISQEQKYKVFQLPEDKALIRMFAGDEFLRKHVIKAESYYVLIARENVSKVKSYLKKFGFLVDFRLE